jgi:glycosyltransferase involved in cell wall biosynthesis
MAMPKLSVVIPVYNEPVWIGRAVADLVQAVQSSPFQDTELVIVDDGSNEETRAALAALETPFPLRVVHQENQGRFGARRRGLAEASGDLVLLLDSRVSLHPDALRFVGERIDGHLPAWNGHVEIDTERNPYACFWNVVSHAAFREYLSDPRTTSFGVEEYDRYPKGTTCFLAPREALAAAVEEFSSYYTGEDARHVNDDTILLRSLVRRQRINISPGFACTYRSRTSLPAFLKHAFHRGTVFFDGFARRGTHYLPVVVAFFPVSAVSLALAVRHPRAALRVGRAAPLAAAAGAAALGRPRREVVSFAALAPPFAAVFGAGIWRGAWIAFRELLRR